jgi:hypothetical protein
MVFSCRRRIVQYDPLRGSCKRSPKRRFESVAGSSSAVSVRGMGVKKLKRELSS